MTIWFNTFGEVSFLASDVPVITAFPLRWLQKNPKKTTIPPPTKKKKRADLISLTFLLLEKHPAWEFVRVKRFCPWHIQCQTSHSSSGPFCLRIKTRLQLRMMAIIFTAANKKVEFLSTLSPFIVFVLCILKQASILTWWIFLLWQALFRWKQTTFIHTTLSFKITLFPACHFDENFQKYFPTVLSCRIKKKITTVTMLTLDENGKMIFVVNVIPDSLRIRTEFKLFECSGWVILIVMDYLSIEEKRVNRHLEKSKALSLFELSSPRFLCVPCF